MSIRQYKPKKKQKKERDYYGILTFILFVVTIVVGYLDVMMLIWLFKGER